MSECFLCECFPIIIIYSISETTDTRCQMHTIVSYRLCLACNMNMTCYEAAYRVPFVANRHSMSSFMSLHVAKRQRSWTVQCAYHNDIAVASVQFCCVCLLIWLQFTVYKQNKLNAANKRVEDSSSDFILHHSYFLCRSHFE